MRMTILLIGLAIALSACAPRRVEVSMPVGTLALDPIDPFIYPALQPSDS